MLAPSTLQFIYDLTHDDDHDDLPLRQWAANVVAARLDMKQLGELCKHKPLPEGFVSDVYQAKAQLVRDTHSSGYGSSVNQLKRLLDEQTKKTEEIERCWKSVCVSGGAHRCKY